MFISTSQELSLLGTFHSSKVSWLKWCSVIRAPGLEGEVSLGVLSVSHKEGNLPTATQAETKLLVLFPSILSPAPITVLCPLLLSRFPLSTEGPKEEKGRGEKFETAQDG